jgi:glycerol-3-phosphate cytidylyltransferase
MKIGIIAGSFDCIHPGYIKMFDEMMDQCDEISVFLQSDPTIERPEKCKPVLSVEDRLDILGSLNQIDHILTYTYEKELYNFLKHFDHYIEWLNLIVN